MTDDFLKTYPRVERALETAELLFHVAGSVPEESIESSFAHFKGIWTESCRLIHNNVDRPAWEKDCLITCTILGILNETFLPLPYLKKKFGSDVTTTMLDLYRFKEGDIASTNISQILLAAQITTHQTVFDVIDGKREMRVDKESLQAGIREMAEADHSNLLANADAPQLEILYHKSMNRLKQELNGPFFNTATPSSSTPSGPAPQG